MSKEHKKFGATTPTKRFFKLAGMTAGIASNVAKTQIKSLMGSADAEAEKAKLYNQIGLQIANTLGEMKGAVMKVGQIASQFKDVFPKEIADALAKLQNESPPMPFEVIEKQIHSEFGKPSNDIFAFIDTTPFAAASIGQVHRARTHAGDEVVVKVQYPGVAESVESDLKHLRLALKMAGVLKVDKEMLDGIFAEIRRSLYQELNYEKEAENARRFAEFHKTDAKVIVPRVFDELTTKRVLTLAFEPGDSIATASKTYSQDTINEIGHRLFKAISSQVYGLHAVHCDPHPGNFAFRADGSLIIYDYGCIKEVKPEVAHSFRQVTQSALKHDYAALEQGLIEMGVRNTETVAYINADFYRPWVQIALQCFSETPFDFGKSMIHEDIMKQGRRSIKYWDAFKASPDTMLVNRAIGGHYWTMKQLGVNSAFRADLEASLTITDPS